MPQHPITIGPAHMIQTPGPESPDLVRTTTTMTTMEIITSPLCPTMPHTKSNLTLMMVHPHLRDTSHILMTALSCPCGTSEQKSFYSSDFYSSLPEMERRNYDLLTDRLTLRFGVSGKPQCSWLNKLESRKRQKSESIASLADDIRQLCQKAYSDLDYYAQEKLALNQLYKLISPEMRCRCIDRDCATVNQAVSIIERYESILGTQHNDIRAYESSQPAKPDTSLETILQRIESRLDKIESGDRQAQNRSRVCFGCNASDHLWSSCPQNSRSRPDNLSRNQNRSPNHRFDSPRNDRYPQNTTHNTQHYAQRNQHSHYPQYNNDQPPVRNNNNRRYPQPQSLVQEN